jgi:CheY-like chemotaxis protein
LQKNLILSFGHDVTLVSTIRDFFNEIMGDTQYDLIIMDIMAPLPKEDVDFLSESFL